MAIPHIISFFTARKEIIAVPFGLSIILIIIAQYDFLTFHILAELFAIMISLMMFSLAWNTVQYTKNYLLLYLASGYFWIAMVDLIHTLAYPGMNLVVPSSTNLSSQVWIAARFLESTLLLTGALYMRRLKSSGHTFKIWGMNSFILMGFVFSGYFPETFIEGSGLTQFKIFAEYFIITLLIISLYLYIKEQSYFSSRTIRYLVASICFTIMAELAFTNYIVAFDISNLAGHLFKIFSFWMIYQALISKNLIRPHEEAYNLKEAIEQSPLGMALLDLNGVPTLENKAYRDLAKAKTYTLRENSIAVDISYQETWLDVPGVKQAINNNETWLKQVHVTTNTDASRIDKVIISPVFSHSKKLKAIFISIADITWLSRAREIMTDEDNAVKQILIGAITAVAELLETRDPYTSGHSEKVSEIAVLLGLELGLEKDQLEGLRIAGLIHDIGKIKVPMEILNKPSRLSVAEFDIIKEHPKIGYSVIKNIPFPWDVPDIVLYHHERWQGQGYPEGLAGENIPLGARILAVADVIDSVTAHRPYRAALGIEAAYGILEEGKGIEFDPKIVEAAKRINLTHK